MQIFYEYVIDTHKWSDEILKSSIISSNDGLSFNRMAFLLIFSYFSSISNSKNGMHLSMYFLTSFDTYVYGTWCKTVILHVTLITTLNVCGKIFCHISTADRYLRGKNHIFKCITSEKSYIYICIAYISHLYNHI